MDIVICVGPNDAAVVHHCIHSIQRNVPHRAIFCIVAPGIVVQGAECIDEGIFPFSKSDMNAGERSGWYLQQLLKLYAPFVIPQMSSNYLIVDADVIFHNPVTFFHNGVIQFNTGTENHAPYFEHMQRLHPSLSKVRNVSGICHLMPMKRDIVIELFRQVETVHLLPFWKAFVKCLDPAQKPYSGASEYEILFSFTLRHFPKEAAVRRLDWRNATTITPGYPGTYEAVHYYMRK